MLSEKYLPAARNRHIMEAVKKRGGFAYENNKQQNRYLRQPLRWQW